MASNRARKLISLALSTEQHSALITSREELFLPNADEDSRCINMQNNSIEYIIDLPTVSSLTVPLEDNIENYSLVQNAHIEIIDIPDFMTTSDTPIEEVNMITDRNFSTTNDNILVLNSAMPENANDNNSNIENLDLISNFSEDDHKLVPYSSSSENDSDSSLPKKSTSRKRRSQVDKNEWFFEKNKKMREKGFQYYGRIKKDSKWVYETVREAKRLKERCKCKKSGTIKCDTIKDEERKIIFNQFWKKYTWGEKKIYVNDTVHSVPIKRQRDRKVSDNSRRTQSFKYHLKTSDDNYVRVCKTMYLNTLGIGRMTIIAWKGKMKNDCIPSQLRATQDRADPFAISKKMMDDFFKSLPTMESHYCRASTTKKYLQPDWKTKMDLYKFYVNDWCKSRNNIQPLSRTTFFESMSSRNLSLYRPKKDECEICTRFKSGTMEENDYQLHVLKKEEARKEKQKDKENNSFVFTVDLQAVLMAPKSNVSTLYYKTKLQVHNLCFYDNISKDGYCFVWNETEGGLNADEFASIWTYFIEEKVLSKVERKTDLRIIIYSDGCGYQNRNVTMSNALLNIAVKNNITIEQKYLEVGHTQMEVDAMHSLIERKMRNRIINVPADYVQIIESARSNPYDVTYLEHQFFKDFSLISSYKSIRPGRSTGDPKVTDIRALMYSPLGSISYKLRFGDPWTLLPQRKVSFTPKRFDEMQNLHQTRLKIKTRKYNDLQQIKEVLPADFREFYNNLPHA